MIKFYPSLLKGTIVAPASKACALRMLFAAAMASTPTKITNVPECKDVQTAIDCLKAIGCKITIKGEGRLTVTVEPFAKGVSLSKIGFNFRDSATTARFLTVITCAYGIPAECQAEGSLLRRSQVSMTSRMAVRGAKFSNFSYPLEVSGRLVGGEYILKGDEGTQFICALLTALPVLQSDSHITIEGEIPEYSYIQITLDILEKFGIKITKDEQGFSIPGQQYYKSPGKLECENDWGLASMWITAAAASSKLGSQVTVTGLPRYSAQGYRHSKDLLALISQDCKDLNVDASEYPNLASLYAAMAACRGGIIRITGIPQLKYKESNRLTILGTILSEYGVKSEATDDGMTIYGNPNIEFPANMVIDCYGDPWVFMSLALCTMIIGKPISFTQDDCADKIYKDFLKDYVKLGGKYEIK